jgi:hypothetical protein
MREKKADIEVQRIKNLEKFKANTRDKGNNDKDAVVKNQDANPKKLPTTTIKINTIIINTKIPLIPQIKKSIFITHNTTIN